MQNLLCRAHRSYSLFFSKLRVRPKPCVGYNSSSSILCVPLQYDKDSAEFSPFAFSYFSGGMLQSKSVPFNDGSPNDASLFDSLNSPRGGYDLFFGSSEADELLWSSLFSPNSTYIDPYTRAVYIVSTFYEPSVQVRISCTPFIFCCTWLFKLPWIPTVYCRNMSSRILVSNLHHPRRFWVRRSLVTFSGIAQLFRVKLARSTFSAQSFWLSFAGTLLFYLYT